MTRSDAALSRTHQQTVEEQFTKTVEAFSNFATRDAPGALARRIQFARPKPGDLALDLACGPGTLVLALAGRVRFVRGLDLTRAMLVQAAAFQAESHVSNVCFDQAAAERLPYRSAAFDLVTCQYALHHVLHPETVVREMARVAKPGGRLLVVDTLGPEDDEPWKLHNHIERLRDPSHVASLRLVDFLKMFDDLKLRVIRRAIQPQKRSFNRWMQRAGVELSHPRYHEVRQLMEAAIPGNRAGFSARPRGSDLAIVHNEGMFLLRKSAEPQEAPQSFSSADAGDGMR